MIMIWTHSYSNLTSHWGVKNLSVEEKLYNRFFFEIVHRILFWRTNWIKSEGFEMASPFHVIKFLHWHPIPSLFSLVSGFPSVLTKLTPSLTCCTLFLENSPQICSLPSFRSQSEHRLNCKLPLTLRFTRALLTVFPPHSALFLFIALSTASRIDMRVGTF